MWTPENRPKYDRSKLRHPSDLTDEGWAIIAPLIPPAKCGGNQRTIDERAVVDGVMYILSTGRRWAALPKDLPPRGTVDDYLRRRDADRTPDRIRHALHVPCRELAGREASPTAAIIDGRSVGGAEKILWGDGRLSADRLGSGHQDQEARSCPAAWCSSADPR